jgi:hypothetical protein
MSRLACISGQFEVGDVSSPTRTTRPSSVYWRTAEMTFPAISATFSLCGLGRPRADITSGMLWPSYLLLPYEQFQALVRV